MRIATVFVLALLLAACQQSHLSVARSAAPPKAEHQAFASIAAAQYLGADWTHFNGQYGVKRIWADSGGQHALIQLRGSGAPALWLNHDHSQLAQSVSFDHAPLYVDTEHAKVYASDGSNLLVRSLPQGDWSVQWGNDGGGEIAAVAGNPRSEALWVVTQKQQTAGQVHAASAPPQPKPGQADMPPPNPVKEQHGDPAKIVANFTAVRLVGTEMKRVTLPGSDPESAVQVCTLADGRAIASVGHVLYLLDPDSGMTVAQQLLDPGRDMLVACDLTQPLAWVYVEPRNTNEGTNRTAQPAASGELYVFDSKGSQLTSQEAGQVQFSQLAGDWSTKRALLARDSVGVLSVDLSSGKQSWALRDSGDVQLHLVGDGSMLWAVLPDGIRSIGTNKLVSLSQSMLASEALPGKQAKAVRTAVEALGWDWKTTVISPLSASLGRYTLFDSADPASELAELDWSPSRMHVSRLLVARQPSKDDAALATKSADVQRQQAQALLAALGWPQAKLDTGNSVSGPQGTQLTYTLDPQPKEGCSAGEFTLWQQPGTVLLTLDAATAPLPQDALSADVVRQKALAAVTQAGASSAGATTASANPTVETIRAGWVQPGRDTLVPEAEGDAKPAYEARIRQPLAQCKVYSVLLEARSGKVLALHKSDCGATQTH